MKYKYENFGKVIYMSLVLMSYLSAVNSVFGIISFIFEDNNYKYLGNTSELVIFFTSGINNILAPTYITKFSFRSLFLISSLGYIFFIS